MIWHIEHLYPCLKNMDCQMTLTVSEPICYILLPRGLLMFRLHVTQTHPKDESSIVSKELKSRFKFRPFMQQQTIFLSLYFQIEFMCTCKYCKKFNLVLHSILCLNISQNVHSRYVFITYSRIFLIFSCTLILKRLRFQTCCGKAV